MLSQANETINLNPNDIDAWKRKAVAFYRLGRYGEALDTYDLIIQAYDANPYEKSRWLRQQGIILSEQSNSSAAQDKYEKALESINEAIRLDPDTGQYWFEKKEALLALGRKSEANKAMEMCLNVTKANIRRRGE